MNTYQEFLEMAASNTFLPSVKIKGGLLLICRPYGVIELTHNNYHLERGLTFRFLWLRGGLPAPIFYEEHVCKTPEDLDYLLNWMSLAT